MKKLLPFFLAFLLIVVFAVPSYAASVPDLYLYGELKAPPLPTLYTSTHFYQYVLFNASDNLNYLILTNKPLSYSGGFMGGSTTDYHRYKLIDDSWIYDTHYVAGSFTSSWHYVWSSHDIFFYNSSDVKYSGSEPVPAFCFGTQCRSIDLNKDNICDDCGMQFAVLRDYSPFTVKKFMNNVGQILTSAVSWVGDVGSTILEQPLLLAFTALPLCGLGIAVFRRLKETV